MQSIGPHEQFTDIQLQEYNNTEFVHAIASLGRSGAFSKKASLTLNAHEEGVPPSEDAAYLLRWLPAGLETEAEGK